MQTQVAWRGDELVKEAMKLFDLWDISYEERAALLGVPPETLSRLYHDRSTPPADVTSRIRCLFVINEALHSLFGENPEIDYTWPASPNLDFDGRRPVDVMAGGGEAGMQEILNYLANLMASG